MYTLKLILHFFYFKNLNGELLKYSRSNSKMFVYLNKYYHLTWSTKYDVIFDKRYKDRFPRINYTLSESWCLCIRAKGTVQYVLRLVTIIVALIKKNCKGICIKIWGIILHFEKFEYLKFAFLYFTSKLV